MKKLTWLLTVVLCGGVLFADLARANAQPQASAQPIGAFDDEDQEDLDDRFGSEPCANKASQRVSRFTYYVTPKFFGTLKSRELRQCQFQGTCIYVNGAGLEMVRNSAGKTFPLNEAACPYGRASNGECVEPCKHVAASLHVPAGSVIYIPALKGRTCQGRPHNGYVIASDRGAGVKREGHFDFYAGTCTKFARGQCVSNPSYQKLTTGMKNKNYCIVEGPNGSEPSSQPSQTLSKNSRRGRTAR